jgi:hypothetical protein
MTTKHFLTNEKVFLELESKEKGLHTIIRRSSGGRRKKSGKEESDFVLAIAADCCVEG